MWKRVASQLWRHNQTVSHPISANIWLSAASEKGREFPAFENTHIATVPGKGNAFYLRHVGDARLIGDGTVFPVFIWIRNNWIGVSQSDARQPIRTSASETTKAVYRPMRGANWDEELWGLCHNVLNRYRWFLQRQHVWNSLVQWSAWIHHFPRELSAQCHQH